MDSTNGHLVQVTATNGGYDGAELMSGFGQATFHNVLIQGTTHIGIVGAPANTTFDQLVLADNAATDIYLEGGGDNQFSGILGVDLGCVVSGSANHGLVDGSCT